LPILMMEILQKQKVYLKGMLNTQDQVSLLEKSLWN
jgi:hypothetical protein